MEVAVTGRPEVWLRSPCSPMICCCMLVKSSRIIVVVSSPAGSTATDTLLAGSMATVTLLAVSGTHTYYLHNHYYKYELE